MEMEWGDAELEAGYGGEAASGACQRLSSSTP